MQGDSVGLSSRLESASCYRNQVLGFILKTKVGEKHIASWSIEVMLIQISNLRRTLLTYMQLHVCVHVKFVSKCTIGINYCLKLNLAALYS